MQPKVRAKITGTGSFTPERKMTNEDFEKFLDTSDEWITTRTGMKERRISHVEVSDLASVAAQRALAAAGLEAGEVGLIMNATCTPESLIPATASW